MKQIRSFLIQTRHWLLLFPRLTVFLKGGKHYKDKNPLTYFGRLSPSMRFIIETKYLNYILRAGWVQSDRDVPLFLCESVSEHIIGMLQIIRVIRSGYKNDFPGVDWEDAIFMTLGHEYGEIRNHRGDITPQEGISKDEKHKLEKESVLGVLQDTPNITYDTKLWMRYEDNTDATANFVHQIDYLQMIIEAKVLEKRFGRDMSEFYEDSKFQKRLPHATLQGLFYELT